MLFVTITLIFTTFVSFVGTSELYMKYMNDEATQLRIQEVLVPEYGVIGGNAALSCLFTPAHSIYSVRWYKNGREFYSYLPEEMDHPITVHRHMGIHVDVTRSTANTVYLKNLTLESTGRYRCEVSGEGPFFPTDTQYQDMLVIALPEKGPKIRGARKRYHEGDHVRVNCTAQSNPPVNLTWYINRMPVSENLLTRFPVFNSTHGNNSTIHSSVLQLQYSVHRKDFIEEGNKKTLKLRCVASLYDVYYKAKEVDVSLRSSKRLEYEKVNQKKIENTTERMDSHLKYSSFTSGGCYSQHIPQSLFSMTILVYTLYSIQQIPVF